MILSLVLTVLVLLALLYLLDLTNPRLNEGLSSEPENLDASAVDRQSTMYVPESMATPENQVVSVDPIAHAPNPTKAEGGESDDLASASSVDAPALDVASETDWVDELNVDLGVEFPPIGATSWRPVWHQVYVAGAEDADAPVKYSAKLRLESEIASGSSVICESALQLKPTGGPIAVAVLVQLRPMNEDGDLPGHISFFAGYRRFSVAECQAGRVTLSSNAPAVDMTVRSKVSCLTRLSLNMTERTPLPTPPSDWWSWVNTYIPDIERQPVDGIRRSLEFGVSGTTDRLASLRVYELPAGASVSDWAIIRDESGSEEYWILDYYPSESLGTRWRSDWKNSFFAPVDGQEVTARRDEDLPFPEISIVGDPLPDSEAMAAARISCGTGSVSERGQSAGDSDSGESCVLLDHHRCWAIARFDPASGTWLWRSLHGRNALRGWSDGSPGYTFRVNYRLSIPGYETAVISTSMRGFANPRIEFEVFRAGASAEQR